MKFILHLILFVTFAASRLALAADTETIILIRHGEKPLDKEIGQLNCQGLNRALALAEVLPKRFGNPQYIFAPGTGDKIGQSDEKCSYLRPLITIAPTAIRLGLPINADFGFLQIEPLQTELLKPKYRNSVIYVAWEHRLLREMVAKIVADLGGTDTVPDWPREDYDSIFVLSVVTENQKQTVKFHIEKEGITPASGCPLPNLEK
jgi:broad specificity phosphatase PhoE